MNTSEKVIEILKELGEMEDVQMDSQLQLDLALDSFLMVMLLLNIEKSFEIELDESDMNPFDLITVQDVVNLVDKYQEGGIDTE